MSTPTRRQQQLTAVLNDFYQKPVARVSLELVLTIGFVVFLTIFAIQPTLITMTELVKEIEEERDLDQKLTQKIAALSTAQSEYLAASEKLGLLDEAIPKDPQIILDLKTIERLATDNKVILMGLSVGGLPREATGGADVAATSAKQTLPITATVQGNYPAIRAFVEALQQNRRLMLVNSVVFSIRSNRGRDALSAGISLDLPYYAREAK